MASKNGSVGGRLEVLCLPGKMKNAGEARYLLSITACDSTYQSSCSDAAALLLEATITGICTVECDNKVLQVCTYKS